MQLLTSKTLLLAGCAMMAFSSPALAVEDDAAAVAADAAAAAPAEDTTEEAPEIVVTAQNREQDVQDVPITMDVIGADDLAQAGFKDANDLSKIAPVAQVTQDQGTVSVTIRGIGPSAGPDTSVVSNIDGEYINSGAVLATSLFDLERVEVLRGPQGTLYGRNSTGGNVNYIVRKPGDQFGANASVSFGNYDSVRADAGLDVPLGADFGARIAGFFEDRKGYVKHPALAAGSTAGFNFPARPAVRSDDNNAFGGRLSLQGKKIGGSGLSIYVAGEYSERQFTPQIYAFADTHLPQYNPGPTCQNNGWIPFAPLITNQTLCVPQNTNFLKGFNRAEYAQPRNGKGLQIWTTYAVRGRIDYEFSPAATLSYIGGYRRFEVDPNSFGSLPVVYGNKTDHNNSDTQSHELRLAGDIGGVIYQLGGFYFKERQRSLTGFYLGDVTAAPNDFAHFGFFINTFLRNQDANSKSLFGQVEVPLMDTLTAVGGVRYTDEKRKAFWRDKSPAAFFAFPTVRELNDTNSIARNLKSHDDKLTWLAGLNWKPDPDTLVYGKASTGFKGGGFDTVGTFKPETNMAYEVGVKKSFGDHGQHVFNADAFHYDYKNLQVGVLLNSAEGGRTFNAGAVRIQGAEAELLFEVLPQTHLSATVNYLDSKYTKFLTLYNVYCVPNGSPEAQAARERNEGGVGNCVTPNGSNLTGVGDLDPNTPGVQQPDLAGNPTPYAPKWIITAGLDHTFDLGTGSLTARADITYKTRYYTGPYKQRDSSQAAFTRTNLSLEYQLDGLSVTAFVQNVENKRALTYGTFLTAATDDIWNWQFGSPRLYGVRVGYEF